MKEKGGDLETNHRSKVCFVVRISSILKRTGNQWSLKEKCVQFGDILGLPSDATNPQVQCQAMWRFAMEIQDMLQQLRFNNLSSWISNDNVVSFNGYDVYAVQILMFLLKFSECQGEGRPRQPQHPLCQPPRMGESKVSAVWHIKSSKHLKSKLLIIT